MTLKSLTKHNSFSFLWSNYLFKISDYLWIILNLKVFWNLFYLYMTKLYFTAMKNVLLLNMIKKLKQANCNFNISITNLQTNNTIKEIEIKLNVFSNIWKANNNWINWLIVVNILSLGKSTCINWFMKNNRLLEIKRHVKLGEKTNAM